MNIWKDMYITDATTIQKVSVALDTLKGLGIDLPYEITDDKEFSLSFKLNDEFNLQIFDKVVNALNLPLSNIWVNYYNVDCSVNELLCIKTCVETLEEISMFKKPNFIKFYTDTFEMEMDYEDARKVDKILINIKNSLDNGTKK